MNLDESVKTGLPTPEWSDSYLRMAGGQKDPVSRGTQHTLQIHFVRSANWR